MKAWMAGAGLLCVFCGTAQARMTAAQERDETRRLNMQAAEAAQTPAIVPTVKDAAAALPKDAPPAAAPTAPVSSGVIAAPTADVGQTR